MSEGELMGFDFATVLGWALTIATAVIGYILKQQNDRDKDLQSQLDKLRERITDCEKSAIRGEFVNMAIEQVKDDLEKMETKLDKQFDRVFGIIEELARRMEVPAVRRE